MIISLIFEKPFFHELRLVDENILNQSDNEIAELLLHGSSKFKLEQNYSILRPSIKFIIKFGRFSGSIALIDQILKKFSGCVVQFYIPCFMLHFC